MKKQTKKTEKQQLNLAVVGSSFERNWPAKFYEEKKISFNDFTREELFKTNKMGLDGWVLVNIETEVKPGIIIDILTYKREIKNDSK